MSKFIYVICDKEGNPFNKSASGAYYTRTWAFASEKEAADNKMPTETITKYKPMKGKDND